MAYDSENYVVTDVPQPPTLNPKVRETLLKARGLIEQGWCRRHAKKTLATERTIQFEYCILGALDDATDSAILADKAEAVLSTALWKIRGHGNIVQFNDRQAVGKADVLALFDAALGEG